MGDFFLSNKSLNITETSRRYAKALFLASNKIESDILDNKDCFSKFIKICNEVSELKKILESPLINPTKKRKIIEKILSQFNFSKNFSSFLITLANNRKLFLVEKIFIEYLKILDTNDGVVEVVVTTTEPLEKNQSLNITSTLEKKLNSKIKLKKIIDKSIIGGIILKVNSVMIDNSIKSKLLDYNNNERLN